MSSPYSISLDGVIIAYQIGAAAVLAFAIALELYLRSIQGERAIPKDGAANGFLFFFGPILEGVVTNALLISALQFVQHLTPLHIPINGLTLVLYFIAGDFCFYWFHRLGHQIGILWADHSIHHSSPEFNFTVNLRHTPFSSLYRYLTWIPVVLLGFDPTILVIFAIMSPTFQIFCHTDRIGRLPAWFEWLFVTPSNHAVHHAYNSEYLDKNFGGTTMLWDHLFGTYKRLDDKVPPKFGITIPVNSTNPIKILLHGFQIVGQIMRHEKGLYRKIRVLLGSPANHPVPLIQKVEA